MRVDVKTVQEILRHQNLKTTLEICAKSMSEDRLKAQGMFLELLFSHRRTELIGSGLAGQEQQLPVIWKIEMGTLKGDFNWTVTRENISQEIGDNQRNLARELEALPGEKKYLDKLLDAVVGV
jgi:hypothetical protein